MTRTIGWCFEFLRIRVGRLRFVVNWRLAVAPRNLKHAHLEMLSKQIFVFSFQKYLPIGRAGLWRSYP